MPDFMNFQIYIYTAVGPVLAGLVAFKPKWFWSILTAVAIISFGVMIKGYALLDEYWIGWIIVGAFITRQQSKIHWRGTRKFTLHELIFMILVAYFLFQSIRGLISLQDWRMSRFILYYCMIGLMFLAVSRMDFPIPSSMHLALVIVTSGLVYLLLYLFHGIYFELTLGMGRLGRFAMQGQLWSGSAYALFVLAISTPASILLSADDSRNRHVIGIGFLVVAVIVASYYESRIGLSTLIFFFIGAFFIQAYLRRLVRCVNYLALILGAFILWATPIDTLLAGIITPFLSKQQGWAEKSSSLVIALWHATSDSFKGVESFKESTVFIIAPRISDIDRTQQLLAALMTLRDHLLSGNLLNALFGDGIYQHRHSIIPALIKLGAPISDSGIVRPIGIAALLADTGFVGLVLLIGTIAATGKAIYSKARSLSKESEILGILSLVITFSWIFVSNIFDIFLFFFMIMPSGLIIMMQRKHMAKKCG